MKHRSSAKALSIRSVVVSARQTDEQTDRQTDRQKLERTREFNLQVECSRVRSGIKRAEDEVEAGADAGF